MENGKLETRWTRMRSHDFRLIGYVCWDISCYGIIRYHVVSVKSSAKSLYQNPNFLDF